MRAVILAATVCLTLVGTTALAQSVSHDYDRGANFSSFRKYAWRRGTDVPDELTHARIVRAIDARLADKGLTRVDDAAAADLLVAYHVAVDRNIRIDGFSTGWGPLDLGPDRSGSAWVTELLVGMLVVDIGDARRGTLVWRSMASGAIRPNDTVEQRDKKIAKATEKMFRNFPPR